MAEKNKPGSDTNKPGQPPKTPGDARDQAASAAFDDNGGPESENAGSARQTAPAGSMGGGVVPGVSAPSGAPTGPGGQGPDNPGPVSSPEKADPGRTAKGTTGAPPSLATGKPQNVMGDLPPSSGGIGGTAGRPGLPAAGRVVGGPADDMSVRDFVVNAEQTIDAVIGGRWGDAVTGAGKVLTVFSDLFTGGSIFTVSGTLNPTDEHKEAAGDLDRVAGKCQQARERIMEVQGRTRRVRWHGEHDATTGAPPGLAADPKTMDPATILMIVELIAKLIEEFRKRRHPGT